MTHPDLYLNIWINQGELPHKYLDDDGNKLVDVDHDGLITFYDLNNATRAAAAPYTLTVGGFASGPNAEFVHDFNNNGRIDAADLLADANWADGRDTDNNGFFDDFFGVNFRAGVGDPFAENNPSDPLGHGTHVAGTIGAIGNNGTGVVGVNWQTSLMSLRILDNNNQGDSGAAIRAINYARQMRESLTTSRDNRVTAGANVRVLNNSWGQPAGKEDSLESAIADSGDAGILFVAAAGNGNILGNGVDNDRTSFYPASYESTNVLAVAASDASDNLAAFSNYGKTSVDLYAPGVGIRSTLPGGGYGNANGTSMATPHVAGTAALIWASLPQATVAEVKQAILSTVTPITGGASLVSTAGRLNALAAINADVFAPAARVIAKQDITTAGGTSTEFTVEYSHRNGIDITTLGDDDLIVTRQWGPADQFSAKLKPGSIVQTESTATATYFITAPDGTWDALDFGDYVISTIDAKVASTGNNQPIAARDIGGFNVRVVDPSVIYVNSFTDSLEPGSLRNAIIAANAVAPQPRTIILEEGKYTIDIASVTDPNSSFGISLANLGIANPGGWTDATTGDFDIQGNVSIVGDTNDDTVIDAQTLDRVFKVHSEASLQLERLTITGGVSPVVQGGGGILSIGHVYLSEVILRDNRALGQSTGTPIRGGGIAAWGGSADIIRTWIDANESDFGGGAFYSGQAEGGIFQSTLSNNLGGGLHSHSDIDLEVNNSTFSNNSGGSGAIFNGKSDGIGILDGYVRKPVLSADGRVLAFESDAGTLVLGDKNRASDIFVLDRQSNILERITMGFNGSEPNSGSHSPSISADGRFIAFESNATNLVVDDINVATDIFVYDRETGLTERVNVTDAGIAGNFDSGRPAISGDGSVVTFHTQATNLIPGESERDEAILTHRVFAFDRISKTLEHLTQGIDGQRPNGGSFFSLSQQGWTICHVFIPCQQLSPSRQQSIRRRLYL